jgi:hypothetical protein
MSTIIPLIQRLNFFQEPLQPLLITQNESLQFYILIYSLSLIFEANVSQKYIF